MKKQIILALVTVFLWGTLAPVSKVLLDDIPRYEMIGLSSLFASVFLFALILVKKQGRILKEYSLKQYAYMILLGFIGIFLYLALYYYGITVMSSSVACIINYLWPMMIVLFSVPLLKEKLTAKKIISLVTSLCGVAVIALFSSDGNVKNSFAGIISCVLCAVCYGIFSVLNKKKNYNQSIVMAVVWLVSAVCALVLSLTTENIVKLNLQQWLGLAYLGIIVDGLAYLLWALALNGAKNTALISNIAYLTPFLSLIFSAIFLKEKIEIYSLLALVLIIGGIAIQSINIKRKETS